MERTRRALASLGSERARGVSAAAAGGDGGFVSRRAERSLPQLDRGAPSYSK